MSVQVSGPPIQQSRKHFAPWKRSARVKVDANQPRPTTVTIEEVPADASQQISGEDVSVPQPCVHAEPTELAQSLSNQDPKLKRRGSFGSMRSGKTLIGSLSQYSASLRSHGSSRGTSLGTGSSQNDEKGMHATSMRRSQSVQKVHIVVRKKVLPADQNPENDDLARKRTGSEQLEPPKVSFLVRKASQFGNAQLSKTLPHFTLSLSSWALVCRAAQASWDVYSKRAKRPGNSTYTYIDRGEGTKAMSTEEFEIDGGRVLIVSICGTQALSVDDWSTNKAGKSEVPSGVLDEQDNLCHEGFLTVARKMVSLVAGQLQRHAALFPTSPQSTSKPSLLFTGHSAGGAVASILFAHMLSESLTSELTKLAPNFSKIHCIAFGAPPVSTKALQVRDRETNGLFLAFANEGDPVIRVSNPDYVKSVAKLLTASVDSKAQAPKKKPARMRAGRGYTPSTWRRPSATSVEEDNNSPQWDVPAAAFVNAGDLVLLRENSKKAASAHAVAVDDIQNALFTDVSQHLMGVYQSRVNDLACLAMVGSRR